MDRTDWIRRLHTARLPLAALAAGLLLLLLGCHYLFFRAAGDAVASFSEKRVGGVIQGLADVYGMLLGMVGSVGVMLFVSIISLMRTVTPG